MSIVPLVGFAPNYIEYVAHIYAPTPIKYNMELENRKYKILFAIWKVEHPKNPQQAIEAYWREGALGPFQIHKEVVDDVNNLILKKKVYTHNDCKDSTKSVEILNLYHGYYTPQFNHYNVAMVHNGGPTWYKATPKQRVRLNNYWNKIKYNLK